MGSTAMECGICSSRFGKHRQPTCPSCARAVIYTPRLEQVSLLVDKEKLHKRITTVLKTPSQLGSSDISTASQFVDLTESARKIEVDNQRNQISAIEQRLHDVREQQERLRQQIAIARRETAERKTKHERLGHQLKAGRDKLATRGKEQFDVVDSECKRLAHRLAKVQKHTLDGRKKLCIETALLAGLVKHKDRKKDGKQPATWHSIGRIHIPDLRELNLMHPDHINASLAHLSRLLVTTAHYLALRLPAEIIPPHNDFPRPAILSLHSSYQIKQGKQRPLHIVKPLPLLAKEDTPTYNLFIDGVVLLAYDVAWLSRVEGVGDISTWEDLCALGKNMYRLFLSDLDSSTPEAKTADRGKDDVLSPVFGEFSHANAATNLIGLTATEHLHSWPLPSLARIEDRLKSHLLTEMSGAEWEMLDEKEWEEERDDERAVLVGGARWSLNGGESKMGVSYMTATPAAGETEGDKDGSAKGWMKLKYRSGSS